jgi:hypothetical protein
MPGRALAASYDAELEESNSKSQIISELRSEIIQVQQALQSSASNELLRQNELSVISMELDRVNTCRADAHSEYEAIVLGLKDELSIYRDDCKMNAATCDELRKSIRITERERDEAKRLAHNLSSLRTELETTRATEVSSLESSLSSLRAELESSALSLSEERGRYESVCADLSSRLSASESARASEVSSLESSLSSLRIELNGVRVVSKSGDSLPEVVSLREQLKDRDSHIARLKSSLKLSLEFSEEAAAKNSALEEKFAKLSLDYRLLSTSSLKEYEVMCAIKDSEILSYRNSLKCAEEANRQYESVITSLRAAARK